MHEGIWLLEKDHYQSKPVPDPIQAVYSKLDPAFSLDPDNNKRAASEQQIHHQAEPLLPADQLLRILPDYRQGLTSPVGYAQGWQVRLQYHSLQ